MDLQPDTEPQQGQPVLPACRGGELSRGLPGHAGLRNVASCTYVFAAFCGIAVRVGWCAVVAMVVVVVEYLSPSSAKACDRKRARVQPGKERYRNAKCEARE